MEGDTLAVVAMGILVTGVMVTMIFLTIFLWTASTNPGFNLIRPTLGVFAGLGILGLGMSLVRKWTT